MSWNPKLEGYSPQLPSGDLLSKNSRFSDLASILNGTPGNPGILQYIYGFAGLALLAMLIIGGFDIMTSQGNPEKVKIGYSRIANSLIGFIIVFLSYLMVKIAELMFSIKIF